MIKTWGTWLGIGHENGVNTQKSQTTVDCSNTEDTDGVMELATENDKLPTTDALPPHPLQRAKGFGGNINSKTVLFWVYLV